MNKNIRLKRFIPSFPIYPRWIAFFLLFAMLLFILIFVPPVHPVIILSACAVMVGLGAILLSRHLKLLHVGLISIIVFILCSLYLFQILDVINASLLILLVSILYYLFKDTL